MFGKRTPDKQFISADKQIQKLRNQRSQLDPLSPNYEKKVNTINGKIHEQKVIKQVAETKLQHPPVDASTRNTNVNVTFNKTESKKSYEAHAHYHAAPKSKKK